MRLGVAVLTVLFLVVGCAGEPKVAGSTSEIAERHIVGDAVRGALLASDFDTLERMADRYRKSKARTSSGLWQLSLFYWGIDDAISAKEDTGEAGYARLEQIAKRWTEIHPRSATAHIAYAKVLMGHGWIFRGHGYSSSVAQEAWAPFFKYVQLGREHLEEYKSVAAVDPQWYVTMLEVAKLEGWDRERYVSLMNEALDREPLFYETYFQVLAYLLPKWHGSAEEIERFARAATERTSAHEGKGMYARIYWYASQAQFGDGLFMSSAVVWPRMKAGFDDVIAKYPDAWNLNNYAKFACLARDRTTTQQILKRVATGPLIPQAWSDQEGLFEQCSEWASAGDIAEPSKTLSPAAAPVPVWPKPGAVLSHYPRITNLEWLRVPGAAYYAVEVECFECCRKGQWCSDPGGASIAASHIRQTTYHFYWIGANVGRWRVWAVGPDGKASGKSPWQEFKYTQ